MLNILLFSGVFVFELAVEFFLALFFGLIVGFEPFASEDV